MEIHCTWNKSFIFIPQFTIVIRSTPLQWTSVQWSLFCLGQFEKKRKDSILLIPLNNLQMCGAFFAASTTKYQWMTIKKFISQLAIDTEFFHRSLSNPCTL
jgi:hypothetical protein